MWLSLWLDSERVLRQWSKQLPPLATVTADNASGTVG